MGRVKHGKNLPQSASMIEPIAFADLELDSQATLRAWPVTLQNPGMETLVLGEVSPAGTSRQMGREEEGERRMEVWEGSKESGR